MAEDKTEGQQLAEKLGFELKSCWEAVKPEDRAKIAEFAEDYKKFIDKGKTEREFVAECLEVLKK
jgi:hypothetical protein